MRHKLKSHSTPYAMPGSGTLISTSCLGFLANRPSNGKRRWQNLADYRADADRVLSRQSPIGSTENLNSEMKRAERIALLLRTREGISAALLNDRPQTIEEFVGLSLLRQSNGNFVLTQKGKSLADSVAEAFL